MQLLNLCRRWPRLTFFSLGFAVTAVCFWLSVNWRDIAENLLGTAVVYSSRPLWLRRVMIVLNWLPLIGIATVLLIRSKARAVRPLAFAAGAAGVYLLTVGSMLLRPGIENAWYRRDFDPVVWQRNDGRDALWPARLSMVDDLLARHRLRGLSRDSVQRLLGPQSSAAYFQESDLVYWLGPERGLMRVDSEWLVLDLGPDERVREYRIVRD